MVGSKKRGCKNIILHRKFKQLEKSLQYVYLIRLSRIFLFQFCCKKYILFSKKKEKKNNFRKNFDYWKKFNLSQHQNELFS